MTGHPKPAKGTASRERAQRKRERERLDHEESAKVRLRSGGRCEITTGSGTLAGIRCPQRAAHVHHMLGGHGQRGLHDSALSANKVHVCPSCHHLIHSGGIVVSGDPGAWRFERR